MMDRFLNSRLGTAVAVFFLAGFLFFAYMRITTRTTVKERFMARFALVEEMKGQEFNDTLNILAMAEMFPGDYALAFEKRFGTTVAITLYEGTEQLLDISRGDHDYDLIVMPDYMVEAHASQGLLRRINKNYLTNYGQLDERFRELDYDFGNQYSMPYIWGTIGISYNKNYVLGLPLSWNHLIGHAQADYLSGKISVLEDYRITMGTFLINEGLDPNTRDEQEIREAADRLILLASHLHPRHRTTLQQERALEEEELHMSMMWSSNATHASSLNPNVRFTLPSEGSIFWVDNLTIPIHSRNLLLAYAFIDFALDPMVAAEMTNQSFEANPVTYSRRYIEGRILKGPSYSNPYLSNNVSMIRYLDEDEAIYVSNWNRFLQAMDSVKMSSPAMDESFAF
jgi:spermidine/putrescine transport system substrate-binding protein